MSRLIGRLIGCLLAGALIAGCVAPQDTTLQEPTLMATPSFVQQLAVKETTVLRLEDNWNVGVQMIYQGQYADAEGRQQTGPMARLSIWNDTTAQTETAEVFEGATFQAGKSYQVVEIKPNRSQSTAPGSSNGYIVIGRMP